MKTLKKQTVAFTGNRALLTPDGHYDANLKNVLRTELYLCLEDCYRDGKVNYITGMNPGWDMLCAEVVLKLKEKYRDVKFIAVIPFMGRERHFSDYEKESFNEIYKRADHVECITAGDHNEALTRQSEWMVAKSSEIIAYDCGKEINSTASALIHKAKTKRISVTNLYEELNDYFQILHPAKQFLQGYPYVKSFEYGREGLLFDGNNSLHALPFNRIKSVSQQGKYLIIILNNDVIYQASVFTDECYVKLGTLELPS